MSRSTGTAAPRVVGARRLAAFTFLFFTGMWLSKTVHPLYFDRHDHLWAFGLSYTAMALAGTASVAIGRCADRVGPRRVFVWGTVGYAAGMALRVVHASPAVAVLSGLVAGLGASSVFIALRTWTLLNSAEEQRAGVVARREFMNQAGMALGTASAGLLAVVAGGGDRGYVTVLLLAAVCVAAGLLCVPPSRPHRPPGDAAGTDGAARGSATLASVFTRHRGMALGVVGLGLLMGFYVSVLTPYLPLLLTERGVPVALVGGVLAVASLMRLAAAAFAGPALRARSPLKVFLLSEGCCALATLALALSVDPWLAACALALRGVFLLGASVSQELLQLDAFPPAVAGVFFGLVQSAFLAGDSLGGAVGGWLHQSLGHTQTVLVAAALTVANAVVVPLFYGRLRAARTKAETTGAETKAETTGAETKTGTGTGTEAKEAADAAP